MKLSVIIPCYNEEGNIVGMYKALKDTLKKIDYELIFIDDGSKDGTLSGLKKLYVEDEEHIRIISFARNFKKEAAMYAGLINATGEYECIIDGDLQQNPRYLLKMIDFLDKNIEYDQVAMYVNDKKTESKLTGAFKKAFYKIIDKLSETKFVSGASDFRMFRKSVTNAIVSLQEKNRFSKGIFSWVGFNTKYIPYEVEERKSGKSSFGFKSSLKYALDGILAFSTKPLRMATYLGLISSFIAFVYFIVIVIQKISFGIKVDGYASLMCVILLIGGIQLITTGILGEYLAKTYLETKKRPIYIARERIGFKDEELL